MKVTGIPSVRIGKDGVDRFISDFASATLKGSKKGRVGDVRVSRERCMRDSKVKKHSRPKV